MPATAAYASQPNHLFLIADTDVTQREKFNPGANDTICCADPIFGKWRSLNGRVSLADRAELKDPIKLVERSEEAIEDHVSARIALFFQQLICCYNVPFHFEIGTTQDQGPSALGLRLETKARGESIPFNAAHHATIPCLFAYPKREWDDYKAGNREMPEGFVYLKGSHFYKLHNSTFDLIKLVNSADTAIDGTRETLDLLRCKSIDIINRVAEGKDLPEVGLEEYLGKLWDILDDKIENADTPAAKRILELYRGITDESIAQFEEGNLVDKLLGMRFAGEDTEGLRDQLHRRRYDLIRISQEVESVVAKRIKTVEIQIINGARKPDHFKKVFQLKLMTVASNRERRTLTKLFGRSMAELQQQVRTAQRTTVASNLLAGKATEIKNLMRDIRRDFFNLTREELSFRANIMKDLRRHKGWSQRQVSIEYSQQYPHAATSQSTICRLEREYKTVETAVATQLATVFGVDTGHFFPALITS